MGQLANVVARIGADYVVPVVGFYLGTKNPYYEQRKHSLDVLVRDCERLYIEFQAATGTTGSTAKPATKSEVMLVKEDGSIARRLDEYPVGDFLEIARQAAKDYGRMIASVQPKHIVVRQGEQRRTFTLQEVLA